jgi:hypothetical protein
MCGPESGDHHNDARDQKAEKADTDDIFRSHRLRLRLTLAI